MDTELPRIAEWKTIVVARKVEEKREQGLSDPQIRDIADHEAMRIYGKHIIDSNLERKVMRIRKNMHGPMTKWNEYKPDCTDLEHYKR